MREARFQKASFAVAVFSILGVGRAGEVAIYTGATCWIEKPRADAQAEICAKRLAAWGIQARIFSSIADNDAVAEWVRANTGDGEVDVLIL